MIFVCVSVRNGLMVGNTELVFSDENVFRPIYYPFTLAATQGTCRGLWCSGWNIVGSFMSVKVTFEPSSESEFFTELFQHISFR